MARPLCLCFLALAAGTAFAEPARFRFVQGETLAYRLAQTTNVTETVIDEKSKKPVERAVATRVDLVRHWKVSAVDGAGVATVEMSIASMRWARKIGEEEDVFDSTKPDDLNRKEMARHIGPVLAVLRIDPRGRLVEVKESQVGPAARFAAELPFKLVLPDAEPKVGESWTRTYTIQLDPPLGTGEKYAAVQTYTRRESRGEFVTVGLSTQVKDTPAEVTDQIPLLPLTQEGTIFFHAASGRYYGARLKLERELKNHQGEGSTYKFVSTYTEDLVPAK